MALKTLTPFPEHTIALVPAGQAGMFKDESRVHWPERQIYIVIKK